MIAFRSRHAREDAQLAQLLLFKWPVMAPWFFYPTEMSPVSLVVTCYGQNDSDLQLSVKVDSQEYYCNKWLNSTAAGGLFGKLVLRMLAAPATKRFFGSERLETAMTSISSVRDIQMVPIAIQILLAKVEEIVSEAFWKGIPRYVARVGRRFNSTDRAQLPHGT